MLVGKCSEHGLVQEDSIVDKLPNPCICTKCNSELEMVKVVSKKELEKYTQ